MGLEYYSFAYKGRWNFKKHTFLKILIFFLASTWKCFIILILILSFWFFKSNGIIFLVEKVSRQANIDLVTRLLVMTQSYLQWRSESGAQQYKMCSLKRKRTPYPCPEVRWSRVCLNCIGIMMGALRAKPYSAKFPSCRRKRSR